MVDLEWTDKAPDKPGEYLCCIDNSHMLLVSVKCNEEWGTLWTPDIDPPTGALIKTLGSKNRAFKWAGPIPRPSDPHQNE
jgi:hypothetical protein